MILNQISGFLW